MAETRSRLAERMAGVPKDKGLMERLVEEEAKYAPEGKKPNPMMHEAVTRIIAQLRAERKAITNRRAKVLKKRKAQKQARKRSR